MLKVTTYDGPNKSVWFCVSLRFDGQTAFYGMTDGSEVFGDRDNLACVEPATPEENAANR